MEMEGKMAEPVRNEEPLSNLRFPESPKPGPVPVTRSADDPAALLPEHVTDKPIGEWPWERVDEQSSEPSALDTIREKTRPIAEFVQDRVTDVRERVRVIRGRMESGELQEDVRERASDLAEEASRQARVARTRAEFYARNYPLQFIAGAAAAGFAIGFLLRMWRDE